MQYDNEELYRWIDQHEITRPKKNISRDFSDALPLVEILKQHYPKLVDLHNYSPQNSLTRKLANWQTLNRKVLSKLKISLSDKEIDNLAQGKPGSIEDLLHLVRQKVEEKNKGGDTNSGCLIMDGFSDVSNSSIIPVKIKTGKKVSQQKMVPAEVFDRMQREIEQKNQENEELRNKVTHLESMLGIKDERIRDLTQQLNNMINASSTSVPENMRSTRFFGGIY